MQALNLVRRCEGSFLAERACHTPGSAIRGPKVTLKPTVVRTNHVADLHKELESAVPAVLVATVEFERPETVA